MHAEPHAGLRDRGEQGSMRYILLLYYMFIRIRVPTSKRATHLLHIFERRRDEKLELALLLCEHESASNQQHAVHARYERSLAY